MGVREGDPLREVAGKLGVPFPVQRLKAGVPCHGHRFCRGPLDQRERGLVFSAGHCCVEPHTERGHCGF